MFGAAIKNAEHCLQHLPSDAAESGLNIASSKMVGQPMKKQSNQADLWLVLPCPVPQHRKWLA